jgi:ADP-heptose:LPS heptosyltransferase
MMLIHTDCKYYRGSMPCTFHKADGRLCEGCADYLPVKTRILIVKLAAVGDVLRTTSILPALKEKYPGAEITWVTKRNAAPLLAGNPDVDRLLVVEENYLEFLRNESFSIGICLDADTLSATIHSLADCAQRFGFVADRAGKVKPVNERANEWWLMGVNDGLKRQNRKTYHEIMYEICDLPLPVRKPSLLIDKSAAGYGKKMLKEHGSRKFSKLVGINTGGGGRWQYKKWTTEGYLGFVELMTKKHPDIGLVLLGGPEEIELNRHIAAASKAPLIDAGCDNSLQEFASIVDALDILLTSDSLAMHIGISLGKPTVVLVGPTSPWELDVFGRGDILHSGIECLSCYLSRCDKVVNCMNTLPPETVVSNVEKYL